MRNVSKVSRVSLMMAMGFVLIGIAGLPTYGQGQSASIDPKADQILRKMCDYVAGLNQFSLHSENTIEAILTSGEKIQFDNPASLVVSRPNKLRAGRRGDIVDQEFYYDGKTLTLYNPDKKYYATIEAPPTLEEALDFARDGLDIYAPAADLIYKTGYKRLMEDVVSGLYIGTSVVDRVRCHHLAFRGTEVDWQIWIEDGDRPLPRKYIVTSKWMTGSPQFTVTTRGWNLSPKIKEDMFTFAPPKDAKKIDFIRLTSGGMSQR
jgi:hypothetical protein